MQIGVETSRAVDNRRIFVVHDDEIIRAALQFMLHDEHEAHELADLEQAFGKGDDVGPPDVLLLSIAIAQEGGDAVLEDIALRYPETRVLLVTETAGDEFARSQIGARIHGLVPKPLTVESVRRKVDLALGRSAPISIPVQLV